ncbi:MAG: hypothetical protein A2152_00070 [Candidatus Levybacteria bacterium RBG_16_35_6]|nr:MAG: hypothetical protein A2152_00070 [Candidatus Levybacteria bacterium RBG_16_35_6]
MEKRIKFLPGQQRQFIEKITVKSNYSTKQLAQIATIHPRSFRDWRREKLTMTLKAADAFCSKFNENLPEEKDLLIERWEKHKKEMNRKGGIARFKKHGSPGTEEGRRKGGIKAIANLRKHGVVPSYKTYDLPKDYDAYLAELVGILLGDGGITSSQVTITLNSEADKDYIGFVSSLAFSLFKERPKSFNKKDCRAVTLYYNGSLLIRYLCSIGLRVGNKVKQQVGVPDWITSSPSFKIACLRGLMDTDGGVFIHRYSVNGKNYMYKKISFSNRSVPLLHFVFNTLTELGFTPKIIDKVENKKVWLYNETEVKRYLSQVGSNNQRLLRHIGG